MFRCGQLLWPEIEGQLVDFTVEAERHPVVRIVHARAGIDANIKSLVRRQQERDCFRNLKRADLLTIYLQHARATLCNAGPLVLEIEYDRVLASHKWLVSCPAGLRKHEQVVIEHRDTVNQI